MACHQLQKYCDLIATLTRSVVDENAICLVIWYPKENRPHLYKSRLLQVEDQVYHTFGNLAASKALPLQTEMNSLALWKYSSTFKYAIFKKMCSK